MSGRVGRRVRGTWLSGRMRGKVSECVVEWEDEREGEWVGSWVKE